MRVPGYSTYMLLWQLANAECIATLTLFFYPGISKQPGHHCISQCSKVTQVPTVKSQYSQVSGHSTYMLMWEQPNAKCIATFTFYFFYPGTSSQPGHYCMSLFSQVTQVPTVKSQYSQVSGHLTYMLMW